MDRIVRRQKGGAEGDRTPDLRIANAALSQLSYGPGWARQGSFRWRGVNHNLCVVFPERADHAKVPDDVPDPHATCFRDTSGQKL